MIRQIRALLQRLKNSPTGLTAVAGYAALVSSMGVGLFSVPLALHFLSNEEFGLWNIVGQSLGYLLLLDFGVSSSASRLLVGPLRAGNEAELGSWWTVLIMVLISQAFLVLAVGWLGRDFIVSFFELPESMRPATELLWGGLIVVNAIQLPFRAYTGILYCQDRWYVIHLANIVSSWVNLLLFAGFLLAGYRTTAYLIASASSVACNLILWKLAVRQSKVTLRFQPRLFSVEKLKKLFGFSSGIFLVMMASQIAGMSQSIIIGKMLGVGAVAAFVVSCKSSTIVFQLTRRAFDAFNPRWLQMYVDGKSESVCQQWRKLMHWWVPVGILGALGILILNRSFSMLYGGAENHEGRLFDLMRAAWVLLQTFLLSMNFIFPLASRIRSWAVVGLLDALLQIGLGILFTRSMGGSGLLLGSMLASLVVLVPFLLWRGPAELGVNRHTMLRGIGLQYGGGLLLLGASFGLLCTPWARSDGWWPNPIEFLLAGSICIGIIAIVVRRRRILPSSRELEA
jgi:O-antigen/teichoic acid export membrane protein